VGKSGGISPIKNHLSTPKNDKNSHSLVFHNKNIDTTVVHHYACRDARKCDRERNMRRPFHTLYMGCEYLTFL
jgi:hypothetical protein